MMFVLAMTGGIAASSVGPAAETEGDLFVRLSAFFFGRFQTVD
jgi:hypothetical protein